MCSCATGRLQYTQHLAIPDELRVADTFDTVTCVRCGFAFADVAVTQVELDLTYEEHSKYADAAFLADSSLSDPPWDATRAAAVADWLAEWMPRRDIRVLDAGCAGGSFLSAMKARGFSACAGIDPSPRAAAMVRERYGINAVAGSFLALPPSLGSFGLVTLQHTLEHLSDVRAAIAALWNTLDVDGFAYVEVPDARRYAEYIAAPFQDFNTEHINHFSLSVLDRLMQEHGFTPESIGEKVIHASAKHLYPAAFGLWRKRPAQTQVPVDRYDAELVSAIGWYVERSTALMERIDAALRAALEPDDGDVLLWGTGQLAFKLLRETVLHDKVVTCVDGSPAKQGLHINGAPILAPEDLQAHDGRPIVIGSIHAADAIVAAIRRRFGDERRIIRLPEGSAAVQISIGADAGSNG